MGGDSRRAFTLLKIRGAPVFVHWSLPAVAVVISAWAVLAKVGLEPALAAGGAYVFLTLLHEFGHATAARLSGLKVYGLTISAAGGSCRHEIPRTYPAAFAVASGGVIAELLLLIAAVSYLSLKEPGSHSASLVWFVFTYVNGFMIVVNLIPGKRRHESFGTDGFLLWKLAARKLKGQPFAYPDTSITFSPETRLAELKQFRPEGFTSGIEILNDNVTPMMFVITTLSKHLEISQEEAIKLMVSVHADGGLIVPMDGARAKSVAAAIARDAAEAGHPFVCRPCEASVSP